MISKKIISFLQIFIIVLYISFSLSPPSIAENNNNTNYINVTEYGMIGDGETNNAIIFQEILDNCDGQNETTIFLPNGTYCITTPITIKKSNIKIIGEENSIIKCNFGTYEEYIAKNNNNKEIAAIICQTNSTTKDLSNITIENINIDVGLSPNENDLSTTRGRGISFVRQGRDNNNNYYKLENILVKNCSIKNTYSFGIIATGSEKLKSNYTTETLNEEKEKYKTNSDQNEYSNFDSRKYYDYYNVENITISDCYIDNCRIGIRVNGANNSKIVNNTVKNSRLENITIQGNNIICSGNNVYAHQGGCGSIALDKSEKIYITHNYIYEKDSIDRERYRIGICQNSSAGPSYNCEISNNYIIGAYRGIWIKDHRYDEREQAGITSVIGSKPGAGYTIKNNTFDECIIADIRIDELLDNKIPTDTNETETDRFVGLSYLEYFENTSINPESYDNNNNIGHKITNENNINLWQLKTNYTYNNKITNVEITSNKELQPIEHWILSNNDKTLSTSFYSPDTVYDSTIVNENIEIKNNNDNKYVINLSSNNVLDSEDKQNLSIIGSTSSRKFFKNEIHKFQY